MTRLHFLAALMFAATLAAQNETGFRRLSTPAVTEPPVERLRVPEGFRVRAFASGLGNPRMLLVLDERTVLVSRPAFNDVVAATDRDGDGLADVFTTVASAIERAHGLARRGDTIWIAGLHQVFTVERRADGSFTQPVVAVDRLPDGGQHPHRTIQFGPDGRLYLSIGSGCNDCAETDPEKATILVVDPETGRRRIFARGLRNTQGFDWHPRTGELWGVDHGTDWRGDEVPPEELNRLVDGANYGWPYCWGNRVADPTRGAPDGVPNERFCASTRAAELELPSHNAAIAFVFYDAAQFPADYRGDAFVALRGSWNRRSPREPKVVRVRFRDGRPVAYEDFFSGFLVDDHTALGRIAGLAVARDGALLVSDDAGGVIYRIEYGAAGARARGASAESSAILRRVFRVEGFDRPESMLHDEAQDLYFVSNIHGGSGAKDGNGYISTVRPDGTVAAKKFIDGLHAPKGLALRGGELWVADVDTVRAFDARTGRPLRTADLSSLGASFLNDVAIGPDGEVYVTDTGHRLDAAGERTQPGPSRIFRIDRDGRASVALESPSLEAPNGIAWDGRRFLVAPVYGRELLAWTPGAPRVERAGGGMGMYDGVVVLEGGAVLVSSFADNAVHLVANGAMRQLLGRLAGPADIGFDRRRGYLLVPTLTGNWIEAWRVPDLAFAPAPLHDGVQP